MNLQVFGCPNCQQPFQVAPSPTAQVVQCPSCQQTVEVPASAETTPPASEQVFACPSCNGQFAVNSESHGSQVACPHCQSAVMIQRPTSVAEAPTEEEVEPIIPPINADLSPPRKRKKKSKRKPKKNPAPVIKAPEDSPAEPSHDQDLFAPGFTAQRPPRFKTSPKHPATQKPSPESKKTRPKSKPAASPKSQTASAAPSPVAPTSSPKKNEASNNNDSRFVPTQKPDDSKHKPVAKRVAPSSEPAVQSSSSEPPPAQSSPVAVAETSRQKVLEAVAHLLPPKFTVIDPERLRFGSGNEQFKVILPDGEGGHAQVDQRIVHIKHDGSQVALVSLTAAQRRRRRLIQNTIAIIIGIIVLAVLFTYLQ